MLIDIQRETESALKRKEAAQRGADAAEGALASLQASARALEPLRAAVEALDTHNEAEATRIAAVKAAEIRMQAENEVAAQLTDPRLRNETATAILIAGSYDWDFNEVASDAGLKADKRDFRKVVAEFKTSPETFDHIRNAIKNTPDAELEHLNHEGTLDKFQDALEQVEGSVQALQKNEVRWTLLFGLLGQVVKQAFERAVELLTADRLREATKPAPAPEEARPLLDLPKPVQEKVREAFNAPPTKGHSPF